VKTIWTFRALDALFFRDGTPFHQGEGGFVQPRGTFPPTMMTLQGAIRTALARWRGWEPGGEEKWPEELGGPEDLGDLQLYGPYLQLEEKVLYPAPLLLFGKKKGGKWDIARLVPGNPVCCDLGRETRLPRLTRPVEGGDPLDAWLTREGMEKVLAGGEPKDHQIHSRDELWKEERRIGLEREREKRTAKAHHLYGITMVRPMRNVRLVVYVEGIPDDWELPERAIVPLGGEGRAAEVTIDKAETIKSFPKPPELVENGDGKIRFTVTLLTPGWYGNYEERHENPPEDVIRVIRSGPREVPGRCVSACIGKTMQIGGWDIKNSCPRPLWPVLPPGSTWFYEAPASERHRIEELHGKVTGFKSRYGMGQLLIGIWNEWEERKG